jgi:hypothetical protein
MGLEPRKVYELVVWVSKMQYVPQTDRLEIYRPMSALEGGRLGFC